MRGWLQENKGWLLIFLICALVYFSFAGAYMWQNNRIEIKFVIKIIALFPLFCFAASFFVGIISIIYEETSKAMAILLAVIMLLYAWDFTYDAFAGNKQQANKERKRLSLYTPMHKSENYNSIQIGNEEQFTHQDSITSVYICNSPSAYAYHYNEFCSALNRCSYSVKRITRAEAKKRGRTPCGRCY